MRKKLTAAARECQPGAGAINFQSMTYPNGTQIPPAIEPDRVHDLSRGIVVAGGVAAKRRPPRLLLEAGEWARGRSGWARLPVLLWFAYILRNHLRDPDYDSIFGGLNLAIHEAGHFVFGPFGELLAVAGGTLLQLAAPFAAALVFRRQRDFFGLAVVACWLATNLFSVARYAADARAQELPLVSPTSGDPMHDWAYMLGRFGLLQRDLAIGAGFRALAVLSMLAGLGFGGWLVWRMIRPAAGVEAPGASA